MKISRLINYSLALFFFFMISVGTSWGQCNFTIAPSSSSYGCYSTLEDVVWTSLVNTTAATNNLSRTGTAGWNAGAASTALVYNNGYVETVVAEVNTARIIGLSNTNADATNTTVQYGISLRTDATFEVFESGTSRGNYGAYAVGDTMRVKVEKNQVKYYRNSVLVYVSSVAPTLPMLVDCSLNTLTATLKKVVIGNLSSGSFTTSVGGAGAGTGASYQWKLNGTNVGTGSTYSNTSLNNNDVLTCVLTPGASGCSVTPVTSNNVSISFRKVYNYGDFYIKATPGSATCNEVWEQVVWDSTTNLSITANNLLRIQTSTAWDGGAASLNVVNNNGYLQFTATETNKARYIGLSTTNTNSANTSIQYAVYLRSDGIWEVRESGTSRVTVGAYATNDIFKILVDAGVVKYFRNGTLVYTSGITPTLPLLVDVSINTNGGTVTNAIISHLSSGTFTAVATHAGTPAYQWQLNGVNTGTNSSTYTNTSLNNNDVITCKITSSLNGCAAITYSSNSITNKTTAPAAIDFYIQGTVASAACTNAEEVVQWKNSDFVNMIGTPGTLTKIQSGGNWDGGAASWNTVSNNGYLQFTVTEVTTARMVGLSTTNVNSNWPSLQYAVYLQSNGTCDIRESGNTRTTIGAYATGDVFKIAVEAGVVKYYKNGVLVYISAVAPTLPMLVDVSFNTLASTISNVVVGNLNTGTFTATAANAGTSPTYQWKLNGSNAGTGNTYTNTALNANDVITCVLTPNLPGCSAITVTSNSITNKTSSTLPTTDIYIVGTPVTSSCFTTDEQVRWKISDLTNVTSNSNNLTKILSSGNWDGGAASWNTVSNNGYLSFTATETTTERMIGLSTSNLNSNYTSIQYAIFLQLNGTFNVYENGTNRGSYGSYVTGDVFKISVEAGIVKYYENGTLFYISTVTPTLPLLVDVSIKTINGTIGNAIVSNLNAGTFTASVVNGGATPVYQWKLNGGNVGTNSSTYTNTSLTNNDVITCVVTPGLGGCSNTGYASNTITNKSVTPGTSVDFYIQGTVAGTACTSAEEVVQWKNTDFVNVNGTSNNLVKIQSNGNWDGGAASWNTVSNYGYVQFTATETTTSRYIGLSTTNTNASNTSIQYAINLQNNGTCDIRESGNARLTIGAYTTGDVFRISVEAGSVRYYKNGVFLYASVIAPTLPMLVDVSMNTLGSTISNVVVSNLNTGTFTATTTNAGTSPTYQWQVNGGNVGTNSATYTNTALNANDVVTCILTPNLPGCSSTTITSNSITNKALSTLPAADFYIQGTAVTTSCFTTDEQVRWKMSDYVNVSGSSNNLVKIQSNGNWDGGAASWNTVNNNGYLQFTASETNTERYIGLSTTNTNAANSSIQYAFYLVNTGSLQVVESGTNRGTFTYASNDVFKISVEAGTVKYYQNGTLIYASTVAPTLPMLVDVSIKTIGGTVTNAIVSNPNAGTFTATVVNAGTSPVYQWKLNGTNVGTNSNTYINTGLVNTDVVSCVVTPNLGGCITGFTSNTITNKSITPASGIDFYIQGTAGVTACTNADEQVQWKNTDFANVTGAPGTLTKIQSGGNWDGGAASWNTVSNYGYVQFTATETTTSRYIGLSTTNTNASNTSIQYAINLQNNGTCDIRESGNTRLTIGTYTTGDVFKISVEAGIVKYYKNGVFLYSSATAPTLPMLVDVSMNTLGSTISNVVVSNLNTGIFTATATNAGTSPTYQWQVNGANVGTNSATYTNTALNANDVVTCILTPNLPGCSSTTITSNSITNRALTTPPTIDFYIQGTPASSACLTADEQVRWKTSDYTNVTGTSNNLVKIQSGGNWDGGAASWNTVSNNGYLQFTATETTTERMIGLSNTNLNSNWTSIQYAIFLRNDGTTDIRESGTTRISLGAYATGDIFKISVEAGTVKYYQNGTLLYISTVTPTLPLLVDVSIRTINATITNAIVSNLNVGNYTASVVNGGASPAYQWKLNGGNVGTNSSTYTNAGINNNDVVTCVITPNLGGCVTGYTSNAITNKSVSPAASIDFYIEGSKSASGCNTADEQVQWKNSDFNNVIGNSNNLTKFQSNSWDGGAASWNTVNNNGYFQFTASEVTTERVVGLSTTNANASNTNIQYGFYLLNTGGLQISESSTIRGTFGTYSSGDILKISVEANVVKYYKNGTLLYISSVTPTLPMLVDVSIRTVNGTVTNAIVSNLNTGTFTATATNAGPSPTYQWQLNGGNVGSNSNTYTNTSLSNNDVLTCILTPNLNGCGGITINSNTITNKATLTSAGIDFYIQGVVSLTACNTADEQVQWSTPDFVNVAGNGNNLTKIQSNNSWDGGAASLNTVNNNGYFQFTATETNTSRMAGLSNTNANSSYTSILYAFYLLNNNNLQIYEAGTNKGSFGTYVTGDVFKIAVEIGVVKYYKNGVLLYTSTVLPTLPMLVDVSIYNTGGTITNAIVSNYNTGVFTATATNAGVSPSYQWQVNGINAGPNSNTYTNTSLISGDIVSCILTPTLGGCSTYTLNSNTITNTAVTTPVGIEFYIEGSAVSAACSEAQEEIRWKASDLLNVQTNANNLSKSQSNGNWDGGAASWNHVNNYGYFQFTATEVNKARMAGLSNVNANADYVNIDYAFYLQNNGSLGIYESGNSRGNFGTYNSNDIFKISVEFNTVKYYQNGTLLYISAVTPTLPLLADISIRDVGGTVTNAIISNYNTGTFTATSINAGTTPSYQWVVNGINVGTNSSTYTSSILNAGDVVTCLLTPSLGGCSVSSFPSNAITYNTLSAPVSVELYIQGSVAGSACNTADEEVRWKASDLVNVQANSNNLIKIQSNGSWNGGAASWNTVGNNGYFQFIATEVNTARMVGLSTANANADYTAIQYAFYLQSNASLNIFESGTNKGAFGTYAANDTLKIAVVSNVIKYYKNSTLIYSSAVAPTLPLLVDVSINSVNGTVTNAIVSNYNIGTFVANITNAGASPTYQWQVNGVNAGTNSSTFTSATIADADVITCIVTPSIIGCSGSTYTSNAITNRSIVVPSTVDFYISGTIGTSACNNMVEEQVKWKLTDLVNVQAVNNDLTKVQSAGAWDGGAASWNTVANNGYFRFVATETNRARMAGLSTTNVNSNYTSIQYAIYLQNNGSIAIFESGNSRGNFGTYVTNDTLKIAVEANVVKYYKNGVILYVSSVAPTLPLLVDVSMNAIGSTITNAVVANLNGGTFTANAINTGASPSYQWYLNGTPVGTNSTTYTNTGLNNNDVISCTLSPGLAGCGPVTYTSNTLTNKIGIVPSTIELYVKGTVATTSCYKADEKVVWKLADLTNVQATSNTLIKITSNNNWDGGAASWNTVSDNGYFQFTAIETNRNRAVGLSTTNTNANYTSIQYAFFLTNAAGLQIYESGVSRGTFGTFAANDVLKIAVESGVVKYYKNGTLIYTSAVAPVLPLLVDVSINQTGGTISNAVVSNLNTGSFVATAVNAGASPAFQWKLNGTNVATGTTYTNTSLTSNDVISVIMTPTGGSCGTTYTYNNITYTTVAPPPPIEFYIQGTPSVSACITADEQVRWKTSDLVNVTATGSNLLKVQSGGNWDGGAASWNTVANNGYFQFTASEINKARMAGLSNTNANSNWNTIQYAFYLQSNGTADIRESGNTRLNIGSYVTGDVFKIAVEANVVKYYKNGTLLYISSVTPVLPMLVDVSLNTLSSTITNAIVSNANTGTYTAAATNAGTAPAYQWKLNGVNAGTGSTYTNTSVQANDVITCVLTPDLGACSIPVNSNTITNKAIGAPVGIDFYIAGSVTPSACITADEQVKWKITDLTNVQATSNNLLKIQSNGNWNGGAASWNTVANNGYFQFTATETNRARMAGLSTTNTNSDWTTIQYAFYLQNNGTVDIRESGNYRISIGTYASGDIFKIAVEANVVKYYRNGTLLYISTVAPTLPMLVDVSINATGGTITNAIVSNYNSGVFTATATNAGASPSYLWKLNGTNVGTGATYTNINLVNNDVVSCVLTPSIGGCSAVTYTSNTITNRLIAAPVGIDFYIQGQTVSSACNTADEDVKWKTSDLVNLQATNNNLNKIQSNGNWNGGAASWNTVSNNGYFRFLITETNRARMVGLSSTNTNSDYTSIQYAFYLVNNGGLQVYESGTSKGSFGSYAAGDTMKISVEANVVKYYKNSTLLYISLVTPTLPLLVDVSIRDVGGTVTKAVVSNYSTGTFVATAINAGASPSYQWKVNGTNVGTGSTYTSPGLNNNDVVTCVLTPNLGGCSGVTYTSNAIVNKPITMPTSIDFYIQGTVATSACNNTLNEQVKWKVSDLLNVQATNNNLNKIQSNGSWNGGASSWNTVSNNGYFQFTASETNKARMAGLSTVNADANYTSIQYAFYLAANSSLNIYESGTNRGTFGTYATNDVLRITVLLGVVKYYKNGVLLYTSSVTPTLPLLVDVSINNTGGTITNAVISNNNAGTFTATATGAGATPTYQWKLNGSNVGSNSSTYTNTALNNNDVITCVLTPSIVGCTSTQYTSNSVTLKAGAPPVISVQPVSQTRCVGNTVTFTVTATGGGLTYQWRKGGANIGGATSASYTIPSPVSADADNYDVVITSAGCAAVTSNIAVLTVNTAPAITTHPVTQTICAANSVTLSVVATGTNLTYQWKKGGVNITGATNSSYTIASASASDAGNYTVVVSNTGCTSATSNIAVLTITPLPVITTQPANQISCIGNSATFTVSATGTGLSYQWRKAGVNISAATSASYTIPVTVAGDAASYDVVVTSASCPVTSTTVTLTILSGYTWNGNISADWFVAGNWSCGGVPTSTSDVIIPGGLLTPYPVISTGGTAVTRNITIASGASVTLVSKTSTLQVYGDWTNLGTFTSSTGTVEFKGAAATQTITNTNKEKFFNLTINKTSGSAILSATTSVDIKAGGTLNILSGQMDLNGRPLALKSAPNGSYYDGTYTHSLDSTARLGTVTGTLTNAGSFSIERYISAPAVKPRILATSVLSMPAAQWADSVSIFGGNFRSLAGFPANTSTLYWYNESLSYGTLSRGFTPVIDKNNTLNVGQGYRVIVGYDNNPLYTSPAKPAITLKMTGVPQIGNLNVPVSKSGVDPYGWNMLGNPYPCELNWNTVYTDNQTNLSATVAILDPKASGTSDYYYYNAFTNTAIDPRYSVGTAPSTFGTSPRYNQAAISSSQGFFVFKTTAGSGTVSFKESQKSVTPGMHESNFRTSAAPYSQLNVVTVTNTGYSDHTYLFFSADAVTDAFDAQYDAYKFANTNVSISTNTFGKDMAMNGVRDQIADLDIPLTISTKIMGTHTLLVKDIETLDAGKEVYLEDHYTNTIKQLTPFDNSYSYTLSTDTLSTSKSRFVLRVATATTTTGVQSSGSNNAMTIYPNPTSGVINVSLSEITSGNYNVEVLTSKGEVVYEQTMSLSAGSKFSITNLDQQLASGVYTVKVIGTDHTYVQKLILVK